MELALNLLWAAIAAAGYVLLLRRLANGGASAAQGPTRWQCIVALTCVPVILFPVISLTDDLHEIQATTEGASASAPIMKKGAAGHESPSARSIHHIPFLFAGIAIHVHWAVL